MLDGSGTPDDDRNAANDRIIFNNRVIRFVSTANHGSFSVDAESIFRLHINSAGIDCFTGPASRNPDNRIHASRR